MQVPREIADDLIRIHYNPLAQPNDIDAYLLMCVYWEANNIDIFSCGTVAKFTSRTCNLGFFASTQRINQLVKSGCIFEDKGKVWVSKPGHKLIIESLFAKDLISESLFSACVRSDFNRDTFYQAFGIHIERIGSHALREQEQSTSKSVFIGHGTDPIYTKVVADVTAEFDVKTNYYERDSILGDQVIQRLTTMLHRCSFAIIIATADDLAEGGYRARQNVVHEIGLFQGRLGFDRVAVLIEQGVEQFSNNSGLQVAFFKKGDIASTYPALFKALRLAGYAHRSIND